ncbi:MAG: S8 family serine peptidase [Shimia sp.]|uniref:S8 family peptidase n=1 Tax=Shimia sp. TaxID=1954381 RepID=UPI003B8E95A4
MSGTMEWRDKRLSTAIILVTSVLAGCGGEDTPAVKDTGGGSEGSSLPQTDSQILLASFLSSLDSVRSQANRLLSGDVRYQVQAAAGDQFVDRNNNRRFDSNTDTRLEGNPIEHSGIHYAHAAGLTGEGQIIAFSDSGFRTGHEAFSGKSITTGSGMSQDDHGTFVASIATGISDDMIGVAPNADAIFGSFNTYSQLAETANAAARAGAVALNNSWGYSGMTATRSDYNFIFGSSSGRDYLDALRNYADDGIVVFSVSNDYNESNVGLMAGLPVLEPTLENSWLAVVNGVPTLRGDDVVSAERVSAGCGEAAAWCISANGSWTGATANSNSSYSFGTGTSYAAPTVSGALALLAEAFPDMTHQELRIRLLASADNEFSGFREAGTVELVPGFEHAYSEEWGHGFLDVAAALLPIGQTTVTTRNGTAVNTDEPLAVVGAASGDAVARSLRNVNVVGKDSLSASFMIDASQMVAHRQAAPMFAAHDAINFDQYRVPEFGSSSFFGARTGLPMQLLDSEYDLSIYRSRSGGSDRFGLGLRRTFDLGGASLQIGGGLGEDTMNLLSDWNGGTDTSLMSMDMALSADVSDNAQIRFALGYALGQEASSLGQSADVLLNGGAVTYAHQHAFSHNDRLSLSLSMPAAVSSGTTSVALPVVNDAGAVTHQNVPIDLAPSDREMRLTLSYERPLTRRTNLGLSLAHAVNRGHIPGARETAVMFGLRTRF